MNFLEYLPILLVFIILVSVFKVTYRHQKKTSTIPTNWPILGMVPGLLVNVHRFLDYTNEILVQSHGTIMFKGPWFANMDMLFTTDPLDIHHILSKNFSNYPKGDKFRKIFHDLGDGIIASDGKIWENSRKIIHSLFHHVEFQSRIETIIWNKVENGLLPILESICEHGNEFDLQDIFQRFAFDTVWTLLFDNDPESLSLDFPCNPFSKALTDGEEAILRRHVTPLRLWRLQQTLRVGKEKKLRDAWTNLDQFVYTWLAQKQKEYDNKNHEAEKFIFFTAIMRELNGPFGTFMDPTQFLRDTYVNLMTAGKGTMTSALSWFFYLLARNPTIEDTILEELQTYLKFNARQRWSTKELDKMAYLHGALCESLRLYPPIPFNQKSPLQPQILPSGHQVDKNTEILLSVYSMGRMKSIWGDDCAEFKPERWISNSGGIIHEPSYKFPIFSAGPRTCLGKNIALSELKIVSAIIIYHYQIRLVEDHPIVPADSMVLLMKHGLKVRLNRRGKLN